MRKALGPRRRLVSRECEGGAIRGEGLRTDANPGPLLTYRFLVNGNRHAQRVWSYQIPR